MLFLILSFILGLAWMLILPIMLLQLLMLL
jgi:hypothetical protein